METFALASDQIGALIEDLETVSATSKRKEDQAWAIAFFQLER